MKKIFKSLILLVLAMTIAVISGCTKLNEVVYSEVLSKDFVPTAADIPSLIAPVYSVMRPMWADWYGNFDTQEEPGNQIVTPQRPNGWVDGGVYQRMHQHKWTPLEGQPNGLWSNCYKGINTANRVIYQIESGQIVMPTGKDLTLAELRTCRAFYYYHLMSNQGNVPLVTDFSSKDLPTQSTQAQIYKFVVDELKACIPLLSTDVTTATYGRFTQWGAKTLLAKCYLNAEFLTGVKDNANWPLCKALCDEVIASGKYILEPTYKTNFITKNEVSKELIFAVPYDEILGPGFGIHMKTLDPAMQIVFQMQAQPWGGSCAAPQFIYTYDPSDNRLKDTWLMGPQYNPNTGALVLTFPNYLNSIFGPNDYWDGFRDGKYEIKIGALGSLSNDFPIFRYADILMMKAECLLRTGDATGAAVLVSQVRARDFTGANASKAIVTGAKLLGNSVYQYGWCEKNVITPDANQTPILYGGFLDELGWEFACEAHTRQDLIRFGVFSTKTWVNHLPVVDGHTKLFPIPQSELNKNPNLKQNPGY